MTATAPPPRISPLDPPYAPEIETMLRRWMPPGSPAEPLALFRLLAVHDGLLSRMRPLGAGILGHGRVPLRAREVMILRTCARAGAEYEWGVHAVAFGAQAGFTEQQIAASAAAGADDPAWTPEDAVLVRLADELHDTAGVSDELWAVLAERYAPEQLLELVVIAGWYRLISGVINATRLPNEVWAARFPTPGP